MMRILIAISCLCIGFFTNHFMFNNVIYEELYELFKVDVKMGSFKMNNECCSCNHEHFIGEHFDISSDNLIYRKGKIPKVKNVPFNDSITKRDEIFILFNKFKELRTIGQHSFSMHTLDGYNCIPMNVMSIWNGADDDDDDDGVIHAVNINIIGGDKETIIIRNVSTKRIIESKLVDIKCKKNIIVEYVDMDIIYDIVESSNTGEDNRKRTKLLSGYQSISVQIDLMEMFQSDPFL